MIYVAMQTPLVPFISLPLAWQAVYLPKRQEIVVKQAASVLSLVRCGVIIK
ncbi:hypothetical protein [Moraxella catarrhalis]|uniref:hypothetical protein n=1 Tax=Moraxella catarrhalis TaxID=480 RepID=UPI00195457E6|nr:hypothetical protein [Moraxella catarrhalis]